MTNKKSEERFGYQIGNSQQAAGTNPPLAQEVKQIAGSGNSDAALVGQTSPTLQSPVPPSTGSSVKND